MKNTHVLRAGNPPYRIQTGDRHIWQAELLKGVEQPATSKGNDLAILQFRSTGIVYPVASFGSFPKSGDEVFASGFPVPHTLGKNGDWVWCETKIAIAIFSTKTGKLSADALLFSNQSSVVWR